MSAGLVATAATVAGALKVEVDLEVAPGRIVALLGPNGAGKTTILRTLAGLQPLASGRVVLDGIVMEDVDAGVRLAPEDRPVGLVFQDHLLFPHLSALDNVAFGLRCRGAAKADAAASARTWLDRVGLGDRADARPAQLSGGEAQRVALARALVLAPSLLLLDEPFAALDAGTRPEVRRIVTEHLSSAPGVRIVVTHDPLEAAALADELVVVEAGRIVQRGTPGEIRARPASSYVADLVGVNLLRGRARGTRVALDDGGSVQVADHPGDGYVLLVIHPRAVALHASRPEGSPRNVWEGVVDHVDALDHDAARFRVRVRGDVPVVAEVTGAAVRDLELAGGRRVWVSVKATEIRSHPA